MENFNELLEQAEQIADRRKAIFNQLISKVTAEILPKFCEIMENFEIKRCFFRSSNPINSCQEKQTDEDSEFYCLCLNQNGTFNDAKYEFYEGKYFVPENWKDQNFVNDQNYFTRCGIVEFSKLLNSRLTDLIKKYDAKVKEAEKLL